jgi:anti-anti-sigma factor
MPTQPAPVSLTIEVERKGEQCIVHCRGRLVSCVCSFFVKKVHGLVPESKLIVLDLTHLETIDSMGLGALVRVYVACKRSGCELRLINLGQRVREMLGLTNLLGLFAEMGERGSITHF